MTSLRTPQFATHRKIVIPHVLEIADSIQIFPDDDVWRAERNGNNANSQ
jgi:hypothetical protein